VSFVGDENSDFIARFRKQVTLNRGIIPHTLFQPFETKHRRSQFACDVDAIAGFAPDLRTARPACTRPIMETSTKMLSEDDESPPASTTSNLLQA
jgi:hypothetical protein